MMTQEVKKYFGTDGIRAPYGQYPICLEGMLDLARATAAVLLQATSHPTCVIGHDPRASGDPLAMAFAAGLCEAGIRVVDLKMVPTPVVALLTRILDADLGAMISASHNPASDNGIKFFTAQGYKISHTFERQIEEALNKRPVHNYAKMNDDGQISTDKYLGSYEIYSEWLSHYEDIFFEKVAAEMEDICVPRDLCEPNDPNDPNPPLKIVLDCAHGALSHLAPDLYSLLNYDVTVIGAEPTGYNINEHCGATDLAMLCATVKQVGADIGFAFDGDGDRLMAVDHLGVVHDGDDLLFVLACARLKKDKGLEGVVGTQFTNLGLAKALAHYNVPFVAAAVGDREVVEMMQKQGYSLGGESSGHLIDAHLMTTGDGLLSSLLILKALRELNLSLSDACKAMPRFAAKQLNIPCPAAELTLLVTKLKEAAASIGGLANQARIVIRPSGTEPIVRVRIEAEDEQIMIHLSDLMEEAAHQVVST